MRLENLKHKLVKFENEYYLVSNEELLVHHWALLPNHFKIYMDEVNYIDYLDSESLATKKIVASTEKLRGLYLIDKNAVEKNLSLNEKLEDTIWREAVKYSETQVVRDGKYISEWYDKTSEIIAKHCYNFYNQLQSSKKDSNKKWTDEDIKKCYVDAINNVGDYLLNIHLDKPKPLTAEQYLETLSSNNNFSVKKEWDIELDFELKPVNHASGMALTGHSITDTTIMENYVPKVDENGYILLKFI